MIRNTQEDAAWQEGFAAGRFDVLRTLPTREQIAEVVAEAWREDGYNADRIADAVLALLNGAADD